MKLILHKLFQIIEKEQTTIILMPKGDEYIRDENYRAIPLMSILNKKQNINK